MVLFSSDYGRTFVLDDIPDNIPFSVRLVCVGCSLRRRVSCTPFFAIAFLRFNPTLLVVLRRSRTREQQTFWQLHGSEPVPVLVRFVYSGWLTIATFVPAFFFFVTRCACMAPRCCDWVRTYGTWTLRFLYDSAAIVLVPNCLRGRLFRLAVCC